MLEGLTARLLTRGVEFSGQDLQKPPLVFSIRVLLRPFVVKAVVFGEKLNKFLFNSCIILVFLFKFYLIIIRFLLLLTVRPVSMPSASTTDMTGCGLIALSFSSSTSSSPSFFFLPFACLEGFPWRPFLWVPCLKMFTPHKKNLHRMRTATRRDPGGGGGGGYSDLFRWGCAAEAAKPDLSLRVNLAEKGIPIIKGFLVKKLCFCVL